MPSETLPVFSARDIGYSYDRVQALTRLSLDIGRGERIALLGANGSGKSTLIRLLAALTFAQQGSLCFLGQDLTGRQMENEEFFYSFRRRVGLVFQNPDVQLFNSNVFDEVAFGPLQLGWKKAEIRNRVIETLSALQIETLRDRAPHRLSAGEKKKVALATVLVTDPEVVLLDEPIAALDPASQETILELLASWRGSSRTVVTATHDLSALESIADRCVVLENGTVAADGDPYRILHDGRLLERTGLVRPHRHHHDAETKGPHGHIHEDDLV